MHAKTAGVSTIVFVLSASTKCMILPRITYRQSTCNCQQTIQTLPHKLSFSLHFPKNSENPASKPTNTETINRWAIVFAEHQSATVLPIYTLNRGGIEKNRTSVLPPKTTCRVVGHPKFLRLNLRTIYSWMSSRIVTCSFRMM
jgi:hypothetical protein